MTKSIFVPDQLELFIANIIDVTPKGDINSMEFPLFQVSLRPYKGKIRYENKNGEYIEITNNDYGLCTIFDKDIIIYCLSQLAEAKNRGIAIGRKIHITAYDFLKTTNKSIDGRSYKAIDDSLDRLHTTHIRTFSRRNNEELDRFNFINRGKSVKDIKTGRMLYVEIELSEQIFNALTSNKILTYTGSYFNLSSPYDRRLYEICRKYCGNQPKWEIGLENLYLRFGVRSNLAEFRRKIKDITKKQSIPDYFVQYLTKKETKTVDKVVIIKK
jgi:plasmid replication initiation protein